MTTRVITTTSSVWTFDLEAKTYTRVPRQEGDVHPNIAYSSETSLFEDVLPYGDRVIVTHPHGRLPIYTGRIESDVTKQGGARRIFAVANIRFTFSLDVDGSAPSNAELTEALIESLRGDFTDELITPLEGVLIDPAVDVKAVITSRPIPSSPDTEHREENAL